MIWDRFDDAHDDLLDDIRAEERLIHGLQAKLDEADIAYKPYKEPAPENKSGPQGWYEETQGESFSLTSYRRYLEQLLKKGGA